MKPGSALAAILGPARHAGPPPDVSGVRDDRARRALADIASTHPEQARTLADTLIQLQAAKDPS